MHNLTWQFNIEGELAWVRLLVAVVLSFALHLILLVGVPVNLTGGVPDVSDNVIIALMPTRRAIAASAANTYAPTAITLASSAV